MSLFRKKTEIPEEQALLSAMDDMRNRPKDEPGIENVSDDELEELDDLDEPADGSAEPTTPPTAADGSPLLDFGSLRIPAVHGMQLRVEMDDQQKPVAVSVLLDETQLQLQAFAAPRSESLWDEVRHEIAEGIRGGQGKAREADGPFGREIHAEVVVADDQGNTTRQPVRFVGIDGERWFLRGLISGAGATDPARAVQVETVFAGVEVERGSYAAPPRDPLEIVIPDDPNLVAEAPPSGPVDS